MMATPDQVAGASNLECVMATPTPAIGTAIRRPERQSAVSTQVCRCLGERLGLGSARSRS